MSDENDDGWGDDDGDGWGDDPDDAGAGEESNDPAIMA